MLVDKNKELVKYKKGSKRKDTMLTLLRQGVIHPFMSWDQAKRLLSNSTRKAFIIRFSENKVCQISISYGDRQKSESIAPISLEKLVCQTLPGYLATIVQLKKIDNIIDANGRVIETTNKHNLIKDNCWTSNVVRDDKRYELALQGELSDSATNILRSLNELSGDIHKRLEKYITHPYLWQFLEVMELKDQKGELPANNLGEQHRSGAACYAGGSTTFEPARRPLPGYYSEIVPASACNGHQNASFYQTHQRPAHWHQTNGSYPSTEQRHSPVPANAASPVHKNPAYPQGFPSPLSIPSPQIEQANLGDNQENLMSDSDITDLLLALENDPEPLTQMLNSPEFDAMLSPDNEQQTTKQHL